MSEQAKCTAIVCAYNEEKTVAGVLTALLESSLIDEIIAVDDGSSDRTFSIISTFERRGVRPVRLPQNRGKGYAMAEGVAGAIGEVLAFVDADLSNLSPEHIAKFVLPVLKGEADMTIGYPQRSKNESCSNPAAMLSGERSLHRSDIVPIVHLIRHSRFGVETIINLHYRKEGRRVLYVPLEGLIHLLKVEKTGWPSALGMYTREASEIAMAVARNYPLALAAFGIDPSKSQQWICQIGERLLPTGLTTWPREVSDAAWRTVRPLKSLHLSAMDYLGLYDLSNGLIESESDADRPSL